MSLLRVKGCWGYHPRVCDCLWTLMSGVESEGGMQSGMESRKESGCSVENGEWSVWSVESGVETVVECGEGVGSAMKIGVKRGEQSAERDVWNVDLGEESDGN